MMIFESLYFWITLVIFLSLISIYWVIPNVKDLESPALKVLNSAVSGMTVAFLFLYAIPNLQRIFSYSLSSLDETQVGLSKYMGYLVSLSFLVGFTLHYLREKLFYRKVYKIENIAAFEKEEKNSDFSVVGFYLNNSSWILFHFCSMFVLPSIVTTSLVFSLFFVIVLGFYFFLDQHVKPGYFQGKDQNLYRALMSLSLLLGWGMGLLVLHHQRPFPMILIGGFIAGVLLMGFIKTEFYEAPKRHHMWAFLAGLFFSSIVIGMIVVIERKMLWS